MSKITIKGTLNFKEYLECHKILAAKRRHWLRSIYALIGLAALIYAFFVSESRPEWALVLFGGFFLLYATLISPIQFAYRVEKNWKKYPRVKREFEIVVTEDGVATRDDKGHLAHLNWSSFYKYRESSSLFLLYVSPLLPQALPKRLVLAQEIEDLRAVLTSKMPQN
ncbi:MAG: YcxB family protein [Roseibacillus sp.]